MMNSSNWRLFSILMQIFLLFSYGCQTSRSQNVSGVDFLASKVEGGSDLHPYLWEVSPGINIKVIKRSANPSDRDQFDKDSLLAAFELANLIAKCEQDSDTFSELFVQSDLLKEETGLSLQLEAHLGNRSVSFVEANFDHVDRFDVDLEDLSVFPNPLKNANESAFIQTRGHEEWAESQCSVLGHEIAEHLSMMANKHKAPDEFDRLADRKISHYEIANTVSDNITYEYSQFHRERGEDCSRTHFDHMDQLIEIKPNRAIILHFAPNRTRYEAKFAARYDKIFGSLSDVKIKQDQSLTHSKTLSYISYENDFNFPPLNADRSCSLRGE